MIDIFFNKSIYIFLLFNFMYFNFVFKFNEIKINVMHDAFSIFIFSSRWIITVVFSISKYFYLIDLVLHNIFIKNILKFLISISTSVRIMTFIDFVSYVSSFSIILFILIFII